MKQYLHPLDYALWLPMIALQFLALALSLGGKLHRQAPRFVVYLSFLCIKSSALLVISLSRPYVWYFRGFYAGIAIETVLLLLVVYEIFRNTFEPLGALPAGSMARLAMILVCATSFFLAVSCWKPAPSSLFADSLTALLRTVHYTVAFAVATALFSVVMYARSLAIPWRSRTAGIAAGFLFLLSMEGFIRAGQGFAPHAWFIWFDRSLAVAGMITLAMWIHATMRPEETDAELPTPDALKKSGMALAQMRHCMQRLHSAPHDGAESAVSKKLSVE